MNILNKCFDKLYIISSYSTQNRIKDLTVYLKQENIKYELIIAPKKKYFKSSLISTFESEAEPSLISANESIFLKESYSKNKSFCIIEDDIYFTDNYTHKFKNFFNSLPDDWDIINIGYHAHSFINHKMDTTKLYYKVVNGEDIVGTHIVAYKNHTVKSILDSIEECVYPLDWFLTKNIYLKFNTYACTDKIFYASSYRHYETDKNEFYKKYKSEIIYE